MRQTQTFGERLEAEGGKPSGFDYMRVTLALIIIGYHTVAASYGMAANFQLGKSLVGIPFALCVPMFFGISGFLVAGSLERCRTIAGFLALRALRVVPALAGEIFLSAFLLGAFATTLPLASYFRGGDFAAYFLNIVGDVHYHLPGVFADNPNPGIVNGALWTVPWELGCYTALGVISLFGFLRKRLIFAVVMGLVYVGAILHAIPIPPIVALAPGLIFTFMAGVIFYQYRDKVKWSLVLFVVCSALAVGLMATEGGYRFTPLPIAYATIYLGLLNPPRNHILLSGDYSYGLYLYSAPLQQFIASLGSAFQHWYINLLLALPVVSIAAVCSWWLIEKPALDLRRHLKRREARHTGDAERRL